MSLIDCPECNKEVSDSSSSCTHCGFPLEKEKVLASNNSPDLTKSIKAHGKLESIINKVVNVIFTLVYIFIFYITFFYDERVSFGNVDWFGFFILLLLAYCLHKCVKAILGFIARHFDNASTKST